MRKKAVVVGIDRYYNPQWNLQGCSMDATVMSGMLQDHFGFVGDNVRLLLDERATKANIEDRLDWLVRDVKPGDVLAFFYAGHGSQVRDRNGDELEDHMDEILCPHDLDWDNPLTDDILSNYFNRVPAGVNLTVIFDCCHSGTATRSLYVPVAPDGTYGEPEYKKIRFLPPPTDIMHRSRGLEDTLTTRSLGEVSLNTQNHVLLSACTSAQEAQEKRFEGEVRGAFSFYLAKAFKRADWKLSYRAAHQDALVSLRDDGFVQIPQLEGPDKFLDKQLFSSFA